MRDFPGVATSGANAPTRSGQVNGPGFGELNLDAHSAFSGCWSASVGLYNLLHSHAAAAEPIAKEILIHASPCYHFKQMLYEQNADPDRA